MTRRIPALLSLLAVVLVAQAGPVEAHGGCGKAVVVTMPGVMWADIRDVAPQNILAASAAGASGSISVRTDDDTTSYSAGFLTLGAGTRADGGGETSPPILESPVKGALDRSGSVDGFERFVAVARGGVYDARVGALAEALREHPVAAVGSADLGRVSRREAVSWALLTAAHPDGKVDLAFLGPSLLEDVQDAPFGVMSSPHRMSAALDEALEWPCVTVVLDAGDLVRWEQSDPAARPDIDDPLQRLDALVGLLRERLNPLRDLLLIVSPTSRAEDPVLHLGVAIAEGPGFEPGAGLTSASTGANGIVTLPDVAPTVLAHLGFERPSPMLGRPFISRGEAPSIDGAVDLDLEGRFAHEKKALVSGTFAVAELALVLVAAFLLRRRRLAGTTGGRFALEMSALTALAFPAAAYLSTLLSAHDLGTVGYLFALFIIAAALAGIAYAVGRSPGRRAMLVVGLVVAVIAADLFLGARLQLTGLWGNDPILGGRFSGLGNVGFAVLGTGAVMVAALMAECFDEPWVPAVTAWMFGLVVVVDGMPGLGSDVGGIIALVPGLTAAWFLIHGRRISIRAVLLTLVVGAAVLAAFTAFDLSRPPDEQTHLARLVDDAFSRGPEVVFDAAARKMRANIGVFGTTPASFLIPPIFGYFVWLVVRGGGSWPRLRATHPSFHRGLLGAAVVTILGFLVNDSGVIVVALSLAVLAPACVLMLDHVETSKRMDPT